MGFRPLDVATPAVRAPGSVDPIPEDTDAADLLAAIVAIVGRTVEVSR